MIRFYRANEKPYGPFSNLFRRTFEFEGRQFPTAEHAYQFGKARKPAVQEWLMNAPSPSLLAMAAHGLYSWDIVPGWSKNKVGRMKAVVLAKFTQHEDLRQLLVATGNEELVEVGSSDTLLNRFWGKVEHRGQLEGMNMLGTILMETRDQLR
ncbi:MAG: NADAR family protein [Anaerolineaceae bacterium]|nr:MAG: NADAR family protein [Anaerolineaceae bacterium]